MTLSEPVDRSPFPPKLDGFDDQALRSLDVLARALHVSESGLEPALEAITTAAVDSIGAADYAGLIVLVSGELVPLSCTGRPPELLDTLQQKLKDGPCFTAAQQQELIVITDMRADNRWPDFAAEADQLGVGSMLCVPLWVDERRLGTLSLYAEPAAAFGEQDERVTRLFATLAALALAEAQRADQLQTALASRDLIGQGKGILMERHRVTADAAFGLLSRASQNLNLKLTEVARRLVETGELPGQIRPLQPESAG